MFLNVLLHLSIYHSLHSEFDWLRNKVASKINDGDYEALVLAIEDYYYDAKQAKQMYTKKGYTSTLVLNMGYKKTYLYCDYKTQEEAEAYIKKQYPQLHYDSARLILHTNLTTL